MTIAEFLRLLRLNWLILIISTLLGAGLGYGYAALQPQVYSSTATGYLVSSGGVEPNTVGSVIGGSSYAQERAKAYLPIIESRPVAREIERLSKTGVTADEASGAITATLADNSTLFTVTATSASPEHAQELANLSLEATGNVIKEIEGSDAFQVIPLEDGLLPTAPSSPNYRNLVLFGALGGLAVGLGIALARRVLDVRLRGTRELETLTGAGVLGLVPKAAELKGTSRSDASGSDIDTPTAESIRHLRTNLRFVSIDEPPRTIIITSPNPREGKSTIASALAASLARSGQPTLLIDADLRRPTQAAIHGVDGKIGLTQVLSGLATLDVALQKVGDRELYLLPAGRIPPNPSELLGSARMKALLDEASEHFLVIIDAPPVLPVTDATLLSTVADGVILIAKAGATRKEQVAAAAKMLERVNGTLLGSVLNQVTSRGGSATYYGSGYGAYRTYYARKGPVEESPAVLAAPVPAPVGAVTGGIEDPLAGLDVASAAPASPGRAPQAGAARGTAPSTAARPAAAPAAATSATASQASASGAARPGDAVSEGRAPAGADPGEGLRRRRRRDD